MILDTWSWIITGGWKLSTRLLNTYCVGGKNSTNLLCSSWVSNLFEILATDYGFIPDQCTSNESKKIRRSSFQFGSSTENKNHSLLLCEESSFKQRGDPLKPFSIFLSVVIFFATIRIFTRSIFQGNRHLSMSTTHKQQNLNKTY